MKLTSPDLDNCTQMVNFVHMLDTLHCIALRTVHHTDRMDILTAWSREQGRVTLSMPVGKSRECRRRQALTGPMATFEGVCDVRPGRELMSMRDFMPMSGSPAFVPGAERKIVAAFVAEVADAVLRRTEVDNPMTDFLFSTSAVLAGSERLNLVPQVFIYGLMRLCGVAPDLSGGESDRVFDMREGILRTTPPLHPQFIQGECVRILHTLDRLDYTNMHHLRLPAAARREMLDLLLEYSSIHLTPLTHLHSLIILRQF